MKPQKKTIKAWAIVEKENNQIIYINIRTKEFVKKIKEELPSPHEYKIVRCTITYEV